MVRVDREKQFKDVLNKLEKLILKAERDRIEIKDAYLEEDSVVDKSEVDEMIGYVEGIFQAYAIVKKTFEGDYEQDDIYASKDLKQ